MDFCDEVQRQEYCRKLIERMNAPGQFSADVHVRIEKAEAGYAEGVLDVHPESLNLRGIVHGGCIATLADTVAGMGVAAAGNTSCVTVNYSMNFLRPAQGKQIRCVARAEKIGRRMSIMRTELTNDEGILIATGSFTFCTMEPVNREKNL